jgi:hypothetical protein
MANNTTTVDVSSTPRITMIDHMAHLKSENPMDLSTLMMELKPVVVE